MYPINIPSVHNINPAVPEVLGTMDLNHLINEGDPIVDENLTHAKGVVKALEGFRGTSHCFMILYTTN